MNIEVVIMDFGSQYTQLIARRVRELKVYCEVIPYNHNLNSYKNLKCIILSGGPASVYSNNSPKLNKSVFKLNIPILGICYGMQLIVDYFGGKVTNSTKQEFGEAKLFVDNLKDPIFNKIKSECLV